MAPALHQQQQQQPLQQQPSPAPRSSSYMLMLNSFASDLDSILNDLSTSPPPPETPTADASGAPIASGDGASGGESSSHSSCPDLPSLTSTDETDASPVHPSSDETPPGEDISLLERLIRSHPLWYLPKIQRIAAAQLLQHQEQGVFIVRQSSQPGTLALSVKLTAQGPPPVNASAPIGVGVQHYLIEAADQSSPSSGVRLESSDFIFDNLPALLAHYCQCCDELPVQLRLPGRIRTASTRQSLTAAALLGQEFWNDDNSQQTIIVTIPSKRNPPVPPLRLSTFDPFGSLENNIAPPATVQRSDSIVEQPLSPRLEARGTEPVPPPPPPRWCKPPVRPSALNSAVPSTSSRTSPVAVPSASPNPEDAMEHDPSPKSADGKTSPTRTSESPVADSGAESKPKIGRRARARRVARPRRRRRKSSDDDFNDDDAEDDDECHHSSLADKASDYEDIWGTSPNQDESSSPPIVDAMEDVGRGDSSSNSTLEKLTSTLDTCQPDDEAETQKADTFSAVSAKENDGIVENKENVPTEDSETLPVVRRRPPSSNSNNSNGSSKESKDSGAQTKRTSPLYSEPADALPPSLGAHPPLPIGPCWLKNKTRPLPLPPPFPSSGNCADFSTFARDGYVKCLAASSTSAAAGVAVAGGALWLSNPQTSAQPPKAKGKVVQMPKPPTGLPPIAGSGSSRKKSAFPSVIYLPPTCEPSTSLQDVVITLCPAAALPSPPPASGCTSHQRVSAYDNLSGSAGDLEPEDEDESDDDDADEMSDDGTVTEFSEPWDSTRWDRLLSSPSGSRRSGRRINSSLSSTAGHTETPTSSEETTGGAGSAGSDGSRPPTPPTHSADHQRQMKPPIPPHHQSCSVQASMKLHLQRTRSFKDKMDPLLASPRLLALRSTCNSQAGKKLQAFVLQLGRDTSTTFGRSLQHFLQCTREAKEQRAVPVLRNVRQFISGIKNFLVQHGEASFDSALLEIRSKLKSNEFLNVDVVLEMVLHQLVTLPLRSHLYKLLSQESLASGMVQQLVTGIRIGREMHPSSLGLKEGQLPPSGDTLQRASTSLERLQQAASPLDKLEHLLDACAAIYNHAARTCGETVAAEDFLPLLAWLLARCGFISAEIEADFMWALLQPSLLAGEGGYFLTALSSAAQLLKNLPSQLAAPPGSSVSALNTSAQSNRSASPTDSTSWMGTLSSIPEWTTGGAAYPQPCVLRVLVADENQSSLLARTVPLRPAMTVRDVTKLLALKLRLSNPQEFTLVALVDGQEIQLSETESPQTILGNAFGGRPCVTFAFRRQDAKIAWPRQMMDV